MGFFTPFHKKRLYEPEAHPAGPRSAYQLGQRTGRWFDSQFVRAGQFLNSWQHRVGFRRRNYVVLGVLMILLAYFMYDLLILF